MYCPKCGKYNEEGSANCISCNIKLPSDESQELLNRLKSEMNLDNLNINNDINNDINDENMEKNFINKDIENKEEDKDLEKVIEEVVEEEKEAKLDDLHNRKDEGFTLPPSYNKVNTDNKIKSYLIPSILTTIFCCLGFPFGIIAIVFASECERFIKEGNLNLAQRFSNKALIFMIINLAIGILFLLLFVAILIISSMYGSQRLMPYNSYERFYFGY